MMQRAGAWLAAVMCAATVHAEGDGAAAWTPQALALVSKPAQREALARGEVLVDMQDVKGSGVPRAVTTAVVDAAPDVIWAIVSDCARYSKTMPRIEESKQLSRDGDTVICQVTADMPFPIKDLTNKSRAQHTMVDGVYKREWKLIEGDYKLNEGSWVVAPLDAAATRSLVVYTLHAEPNITLPGFVLSGAQKKALPELMQRLRAQTVKPKKG